MFKKMRVFLKCSRLNNVCVNSDFRPLTVHVTYPTANHSPVGQYPNEKICDVKSCCCN